MNPGEAVKSMARWPIGQFLIVQAALLAAGASWGGYRVIQLEQLKKLPTLREQPLFIEPRYDYPVVVSDEQLTRVLTKLVPRFEGEKTKINHTDHGLRFWTMAAEFDDEQLMSGKAMRHLLTDHRRFQEVYGPEEPPLLMDVEGQDGVRVRVQEGAASSSHVDHTMACLAEVGTSLSFPLWTPTRRTTFAAMIEQSLRDFSLNQVEYEWSALTYALFLPPVSRWITTEGQEVSFDLLAERIMRQELPQGVCFANHRMHALVTFLRVDDQTRILSPQTRAKVIDYLRDITQILVATQNPDGYWDGNWPHQADSATESTTATRDPVVDRILATGHALEWWSLAPEEVLPPRNVLASAGQWLVRAIDELTDEKVRDYFTFLSHAGKALANWRARPPALVPLEKTTAPSAKVDGV